MVTENNLSNPGIGNNPIVDHEFYKENGFSSIRGFINEAMIERLSHIIETTGNGTTFDTIKKNAYNTAINDEYVKSIVQDKSLAKLIGSLGYGDCIFTDGVIFETDQNLFGFDWHLDITSFKYIYPEDKAFSIWVTLDPIDPKQQDGGLTMLSTAVHSGKEFFKLQSKVTKSLYDGLYKIPNIYKTLLEPKYRNEEEKTFKKLFPFIQKKFPHLFSDSIYISGFTRNLFDSEGLGYTLSAGDAIIFDKNVFHRSNPLKQGPMNSRKAFVMRFIEASSKFNAINALKAGGDDSVLISKIVRNPGMTFDLSKAILIKVYNNNIRRVL